MPERLYIVDGHGYIFRAHYGLMNASRGECKEVRLSTSEGMPTGALYVFARMLMRLEEEFDIEVSDQDAEKLPTVQDIVNYVEETPYFCAEVLPRLKRMGLRAN